MTFLDEVFLEKYTRRCKAIDIDTLVVKVIKKVNKNEFLVADATGFCKIKIHDLEACFKRELCINNFIIINDAKIDYQQQEIILDYNSEVTIAREFLVDETNPAKVCIFPLFTLLITINKIVI